MQCRLQVLMLLGVLSALVSGQSLRTEDIPPAFPREGATRVLENEWVTAWDATWIPNKSTAMHRHAYDYFGVELTDSRTDVIESDGSTRTLSMRRGLSWFIAKGATHREIGISANPPRRAILVDRSDVPSPSYVNSTRFPLASSDSSAKKLVDNARVTMWEQAWAPGQEGPMSFYPRNVVVMFVDGGELTVAAPDRTTELLRVATG